MAKMFATVFSMGYLYEGGIWKGSDFAPIYIWLGLGYISKTVEVIGKAAIHHYSYQV